jgi:tellurite resistance protein
VLTGPVQLRFLPLYIKLHFVPGFWALTFSYAAAAADALEWFAARHPAGSTAYATILISATTSIFIVAVGRTVIAVARRQLFPRSPAPPLDAVHQTVRAAAGTPAPRSE